MAKKQKTTATTIIPAEEAAQYRKSSDLLVHKAEDLAIKTSTDENDALAVLQNIKRLKKEVEDRRTSITKPLNAGLKAANALFKELAAPLLEADRIIRDKVTAFHVKREEQAAKKVARLEEKQEALYDDGDDAAAEAMEAKIEAVRPQVGNTTVVKRWVFDVINEAKVPREYLCVDEKAVRAAVRNGVRDIAGVEIYQTTETRI